MAVAVVVVAVSAVVASAASATEPYFVAVKGALPMKGTATVGESHLYFSGFNTEIVCKKGSGSGEFLNRTVSGHSIGGLQKGTITFEECTLLGAGTCEINGKGAGKGVITLTEVTGMLGYVPGTSSGTENVRFELESANQGGLLTTIKFTGASCSTAFKNQNFPITKGVVGAIPAADIEKSLSEVTLALGVSVGQEELSQEFKEIESPLLGLPNLRRTELLYGSHPLALKDVATLKLEAGNTVEIHL